MTLIPCPWKTSGESEGLVGVKVREKPKGSGVWWVFIHHQGHRKAKKVGKEETAKAVAQKIQAKLILGELNVQKINSNCSTFKENAELWVGLPHDWKQSTRTSYMSNLKMHIYPQFGKMRLDAIKRKDIKIFFDKLMSNGKAANTVAVIRATLSGVFSHAIDSELIDINPTVGLKLPRRKSNLTIEPLTGKEAEQLLDQAKKHLGGSYYPLVLCALRTGMRLGEMRALKWKDIDFKKRMIEIRRSCRRYEVTSTKTGKNRRVDMTPHLSETLRDLETKQKKDALRRGTTVPEWVFADKDGDIFHRWPFEVALNRCLKAAGLRRIRIHDLRHSYATIRLLRGHNIGDVSYQMGHSSIKITYDIYTHWLPGKFKNEVDDLDKPQPNAPYAQPEIGVGHV